jgi:hypothetical protein
VLTDAAGKPIGDCEAADSPGRGCEVDCLRNVAPAQPSHGEVRLVQQTNPLSPRRLAVSLQPLSEFQGRRRSGSSCDMRLARTPSFRSATSDVQRSLRATQRGILARRLLPRAASPFQKEAIDLDPGFGNAYL